MIRRPPRSTLSSSAAASDVYKRQPFGLAVAREDSAGNLRVRGPFRLGGAALELSRFPRSRSLGGPHDLDELLDGGCPSQTRARLEEAACEPHTCPRLGKGIGSVDAHGG